MYFLLGNLPVEGVLHLETLGLFYNLWSNPQLSVHETVLYILKMCKSSSTTWSNHRRLIGQQFGIPCQVLSNPQLPPGMRLICEPCPNIIQKCFFLNIDLHGLTGRPHPALLNIFCKQDVKKLRVHLKFLTCDVSNSCMLSDRNNRCLLCFAKCSVEHVLVSCPANKSIRESLLPSLLNRVSDV